MAWWTGQPVYGSNPVSKFIRENFAYLKTYVDYIVNSGVTTADLAAVHALPPTLAAVVNITVNTTIGNTEVGLGGGYNISGGTVLTIDGSFSAPIARIFFGTGTVVFTASPGTDVHPEWWGGIPDGVIDCTAAIQAAVVSVEASPGYPSIHFSATDQYYKVTAPIVITGNNKYLVFKGDNIITSQIRAVNVAPFSAVFFFATATPHIYNTFKDIDINCNSAANYGIYSIYNVGASGASDFRLDHMRVSGSLVEAIHLEYGWDIDILQCVIVGNTGNGINLSNSANACNLIGNKVFNNGGIGIILNGGSGGSIIGNTIETNTNGGLYINALSAPYVTGNYFEGNGNNAAGENYQIWWGAISAYTYGGELRSNYISCGGVHAGIVGVALGYCYGTTFTGNHFEELDYAWDATTLPAGTALMGVTIEDNSYDATVVATWNAHGTFESNLSLLLNKIRIPGLFELSNGNLIIDHPLCWSQTLTAGCTVNIVAGKYPAFQMVQSPGGGTCQLYTAYTTTDMYDYLLNKYVSFGITAKADVATTFGINIDGVTNTVNIGTTPTEIRITHNVTADFSIYLLHTVQGRTITILDVWFTLGTVPPEQELAKNAHRSGAASPAAAVVPLFIGEEYLHTTGNHWFKAHGITNADWTALN